MKARDPICGCTVETTFTSRRHNIGGFEYYFCSDACMSQFLGDPGHYINSSKNR
jgi:Cu+-exporting ATPase